MNFLNDGIKRKQSTIDKIVRQVEIDYEKLTVISLKDTGGFTYKTHVLVADENIKFIQKDDGFYLQYKDVQINKSFKTIYDATVYIRTKLEKYVNPKVDSIVMQIFTQLKQKNDV